MSDKEVTRRGLRRVRASVVCVHNGALLVFKAVDPVSGKEYAFVPGGKVEPGEYPAETAAREASEETGYDVVVDASSELVSEYVFHWNGEDHDCKTYFYCARLKESGAEPKSVDDASYNLGAYWLPLSEVNEKF